jgi:hypothetical protein
LLNNEERDSNYALKHLRRWVYVADIRHTFYNVSNLYDLFTYVPEDTTLKFDMFRNVFNDPENDPV